MSQVVYLFSILLFFVCYLVIICGLKFIVVVIFIHLYLIISSYFYFYVLVEMADTTSNLGSQVLLCACGGGGMYLYPNILTVFDL